MMDMERDNGTVDAKIIEAIEQFWEFQLPKDYKKFLMEHNGGVPKRDCFSFKDSSDGSCIDDFFGIIKDFNNNLLLYKEYAGKRVPENTLPIGDDVYGNLILLSVKGPDRNKIYFWDHERESADNEKPDYSNLTLVADTFSDFIDSLYEFDESTLPVS